MAKDDLKKALEAFLLVSSSPVHVAQVKETLGKNEEDIRAAFEELKTKYENDNAAFKIIEVAGGYRLSTSPDVANYLKKWFRGQKPRLSKASLETLSIIAYKQPITRSDMEAIRGVNIDGALGTLLDRGLIRIVGRKETVGRPFVYGTTRLFLEHFGLNTLRDLPALNEFAEIDLREDEKEKLDSLKPSEDKAVQPKADKQQ